MWQWQGLHALDWRWQLWQGLCLCKPENRSCRVPLGQRQLWENCCLWEEVSYRVNLSVYGSCLWTLVSDNLSVHRSGCLWTLVSDNLSVHRSGCLWTLVSDNLSVHRSGCLWTLVSDNLSVHRSGCLWTLVNEKMSVSRDTPTKLC